MVLDLFVGKILGELWKKISTFLCYTFRHVKKNKTPTKRVYKTGDILNEKLNTKRALLNIIRKHFVYAS